MSDYDPAEAARVFQAIADHRAGKPPPRICSINYEDHPLLKLIKKDVSFAPSAAPQRTTMTPAKHAANAERGAHRRLPSPHAVIIRDMKRATLLPAPGTEGLTADERRNLRNRMKAAR